MLLFKRKTYNDVLYEWLSYKKDKVKESSYLKYLNMIESYIIDLLGNIDFKKLKNSDIKSFFENEKISGLSESVKNNLFIILNASINYGVKKKYRKKIILEKIQFKDKKKTIKYLTRKEQEILVNYLTNNMNLRNLSILLGLSLGIRIGEICALKWECVDFENKTISINLTAQRIKDTNNKSNKKTKLIVDLPKTESSIRVIPIPEMLIPILKEYKKDDEYFIFTNDASIPKDPRALEKYFDNVLKRIGIKHQNFHSLRHTFATRLREQKVDIKVISELLGHSDWRTTQSIYVHASVDYKRESVDTFNCCLPC